MTYKQKYNDLKQLRKTKRGVEMYNKISIFLTLLIFIVVLFLSFGLPFLIPKIVIWVCLGLFNIDLSDKYWYIFWAWVLLSMLFGTRVTVNRK